jgi:hypothetical protein
MKHIVSSIPYPLNLLPHVSSNNVGHLELKNLSAYLFLVYQLICLEFGGMYYTVGKVLKKHFQWYITCPKTFKNYSCKTKKEKFVVV